MSQASPVTFTLTPADMTEMHRYGMNRIPAIQRNIAIQAMLIFIVAVSIAGFLEYQFWGVVRNIFYVAGGIAAIPGVLMIWGFFYLNVPNQAYIFFIRSHGKGALTQTITLEADGIRQQRNDGQTDTLWKFGGFTEATESQNLYLVLLATGNRMLIIPKRAFETPEAGQLFFEALKKCLPGG